MNMRVGWLSMIVFSLLAVSLVYAVSVKFPYPPSLGDTISSLSVSPTRVYLGGVVTISAWSPINMSMPITAEVTLPNNVVQRTYLYNTGYHDSRGLLYRGTYETTTIGTHTVRVMTRSRYLTATFVVLYSLYRSGPYIPYWIGLDSLEKLWFSVSIAHANSKPRRKNPSKAGWFLVLE
jgi:hypothetical protein